MTQYRLTGILVILTFFLSFAAAHDLDLTLVKIDRNSEGTKVEVATPLSRLVATSGMSGQPSGPELDLVVRDRLRITEASPADLRVDSKSDSLVWSTTLDSQTYNVPQRFDSSTPAAQTIVREFEQGRPVSEHVLETKAHRSATGGMVPAGVHHILSGWDHILFVVGLALLGGARKVLFQSLTAFALAHTLSLSLAALGFLRVPSGVVEPIIALSLVVLAWEGFRLRVSGPTETNRTQIWLALGSGLVHGLGFGEGVAQALAAHSSPFGPLTMFTLGIELGQFLVLAPAALAVAMAFRWSEEKAPLWVSAASVGIGMMGCFWFVERLI